MSLARIAADIEAQSGIRLQAESARSQSGGSINQAWRMLSSRGPVFLKINAPDGADMFAAEVDGLCALARCDAVAVPTVLAHGCTPEAAFLLLEWVDLSGPKSAAAAGRLGRRLALQHRHGGADFGWNRDNTIGTTPQANTPSADWSSFFRARRLKPQLELARVNGYRGGLQRAGRALLDAVPALLAGHSPPPALLHGDLWGGNWGVTAAGEPYLFDPAVYRGDREADIAMTRLFGGFRSAFYRAYVDEWPLPAGWEERAELYNLYHVLNHLNLFGGGYLRQAEAIIGRLLERAR